VRHERRTGDAGGGAFAAPPDAVGGDRVLAVDVGLGTADILLTLPGEPLENAVRLVVPSRTQVVAREIAAATAAGATVVFHGPVMGGGASGAAMKRHLAAGLRFVAGESAALTFADDLERVRARGVEVVSDAEAAAMAAEAADDRLSAGGPVDVRSGDLDPDGLRAVLERLGVDPRCDAVCVAAQDHGFSPDGSNRAFRFGLWEEVVAGCRPLAALFFERAAIPPALTRLRAAADLAAELTDGPVLAADTGPAALYGALPDGAGDAVIVNVGNGHVVCAVARDGRLAGVFEHHTARLDGPGLETRLRRFFAGELTSAMVREDGGHGAVLAAGTLDGTGLHGELDGGRATGISAAAPIIVTGPRRDLLRGSGLPLEFAAPHGDMMLTGCYGLLRALRERAPLQADDGGLATRGPATPGAAPA
jgi:uncharacterized protein (DUF1786 family)